ncbi:hypothetical protein JDV02_004219 [Purpureocillium takamizusanense]|uniref:Major facilitator superfamily transporter n=1 Tax=Purpureocillium takamizusanense TaxID=2060973 RepID=A0A9Q8QFF4_9HYPO|nr:uncharacterized protein JDV02_004219 [Purpureocillium takamizusanense]UNI17911.1 hypothetical protein JDV02_004219 [Purpureocillium takamizusanense]
MDPDPATERDESFWAPGTVTLEDLQRSTENAILHPRPTTDPNDPLNWSTKRKMLNFVLVNVYVFFSFVQLDIFYTAPGSTQHGRRPVYILSTALQLASCIWLAVTRNVGDLYGGNLLSGLSGAISETIAQITIADLFFVHQHTAMNGWYLLALFTGSYLGPVAAGYIVDSQGWRWIWWWCVIFFVVNVVLIVVCFEETKYVGPSHGSSSGRDADEPSDVGLATLQSNTKDDGEIVPTQSMGHIDPSIPMRPYRERLALITPTKGSILFDLYNPVATYLFDPPYNFSAAGVGLMNVAPLTSAFPAIYVGGHLNDKSIIWLSKRNGGVYEPEMRLWVALIAAIVTPAGILMFGLGMANKAHWAILAVGWGVYGFGLIVACDSSLSYAMDCYHAVIGNALVGIVFTRNAVSGMIL